MAEDKESEVKKSAEIVFCSIIEKGGDFEPEADRYHLYVSLACPWATRTLIARKLKGLEHLIPVTVVSPHLGKLGWPFANIDPYPGAEIDTLNGSKHIRDIYSKASPGYNGRFSVPVLWDKKIQTIVNNESSEILRMFNDAFNDLLPPEKGALDLYPEHLRKEIDEVNEWVLKDINSGVYRAGFAATQAAYETAVGEVFGALDKAEERLKGRNYLVGDQLTEADIRLFATTIRFDVAYVGQFKCNLRTIRHGYPSIHQWMQKLYWENDAFQSTTDFDHIKVLYYGSDPSSNNGIVPVGPVPNILPL
ncbi:hypothetical protein H0H92_008162 [Tricholoma furcatifolium]|nr:hypothetical protein H0H92_008162 [Tricholoma furcatifolium]